MRIDRVRPAMILLGFGAFAAACMATADEPLEMGTGGNGFTGTGGSSSPRGTGGFNAPAGTGGAESPTGSGGANSPAGTGGAESPTGTGGSPGTGGRAATGGMSGTGGARGTGGAVIVRGTGGSTTGAGGTIGTDGGVDPCTMTTVPSGGTQHTSTNASGNASGLNWTIWSNGSAGSITTYSTPAFSAAWNNSGDFLARLGLQWNQSKTFDQYGTITAQYAQKKTGTGGGYSYIGIYGWSVSPCVEFYIVDDSYNRLPVNPGNTTNKGTAMIDGGTYTLYTRPTSGTGGSKCPGTSNWMQFYSVRQSARQCGQITISDHFKAWAAAGMTLGKMDQAQLLVEVGGGSGSIDFTMASVTTSQ